MATTQYRRPIRYSETTLKEATTNLQRLRTAYENAGFRLADAQDSLPNDTEKLAEIQTLIERFIEEMDDDFNTANGITVIYELAKWLNLYSEQSEVSKAILEEVRATFTQLLEIFGIVFQEELVDSEIDALIEERNQARKDRNFSRSDEIRDLLKEQGILLEDTPQGTRWRKE
jgi:cysteinyl-tRNA synthetase